MDTKTYEEWVKQKSEFVYRIAYYMTRDVVFTNKVIVQVFVETYKEMRRNNEHELRSDDALGVMTIKTARRMIKEKKAEQGENS